MVPFEIALMSSYRPSIVTFHLSLRVSEILAFLCSATPLCPTPPLSLPKFPRVPVALGGWLLGYEERRCWANCSSSYFPRFTTYVILIHQRYRQTDRQTDGQADDMQSQYLDLHYSASRDKKDAGVTLSDNYHDKITIVIPSRNRITIYGRWLSWELFCLHRLLHLRKHGLTLGNNLSYY